MASGRDNKQVPYVTPWRAPLTEKMGAGERHLIQYIVDFTSPSGASAWWEVLFISASEATRWARWELERTADGEAGWTAEVSQGHWEHTQKKARFVVDVEGLATVGPSTGNPPAAGTED
jgi:hypothetical protein